MTRSHTYPTHSYSTLRRHLVLWLAVLVALAGPAVAHTLVAEAALSGHTATGAFTRFAIDGDLDGADDWAGGGYGPNTTDQGRRSVGIVDLVEGTDACREDPDGGYTGSIDGVPYPWPTTDDAAPNDKTDICNIGVAYEVVEIDGQYHWVLYHYVARSGDATGDMSTVVVLDRVGQVEDTLIEFDFSPSSGTAPRKHVWNGTEWIASGLDSGFDVAVGANPFEPGADPGTFVELAVDLTANGLLPPVGVGGEIECGPFTVAGAASFTGNDANSSLKDRADFAEPISLSSCTDLLVAKQAVPAGISTSDTFTYRVDRADGQPSHNATLEATGGGEDVDGTDASITSPVRVGETHTWTNVLAAPDYRLDELSLPDGWSLQGVECTWYDPFAGTTRTEVVTAGAGAPATFQVPPRGLDGGTPTSCTITNETSGLVIAKTGSGDPAAEFTFEVTGKDDQVLSLGESTGTLAFEPGTAVTVSESLPTQAPAWQARGVECRDGSDTVVASGAADGVEVTTVGGEVIACTFTNEQQAGMVVVKSGEPTGSGQAFDFEWDVTDGDLDGLADFQLEIDGPAEATGDIAPGTYTVKELLEAVNLEADPDFVLGGVACEITTAGDGGSTWTTSVDDAEAVVTVAAGDVVTCTFTNVQAGRLVVDKETDGHDGTFAFSGAVEGSITTLDGATLAGEELVVDLPAGTWDVTEAVPAGWDLAGASCDDGSGTTTPGEDSGVLGGIEVGAGEIVTCTFTNEVETATLTLTKDWGETAEPGDAIALAANGDDPATTGPATGGSTAPDIDDDPVLTIHAGEQVVLEETHDADNTGSYEAFLACDPAGAGSLSYTAGDISGTFTVPADDPADVTCTFLNERRTAQLVLQKQWIAGHAGDTATLTATATNSGAATSTATGGDQLDETDRVVVEVLAGEVVDLAEQLGDNTGTYTTSLACTDPAGLDWTEGERSGTYTVPALPEDVTCTFTNTRTRVDLVLEKEWIDAAAGDGATLAFTGQVSTPSNDSVATGVRGSELDSPVAVGEVLSGEVVAISELLDPANAAVHSTSLTCDGGELAHDRGEPDADLGIPSDATDDITCRFTNTAHRGNIVVVKNVEGEDGTFDFTADWPDPATGEPLGDFQITTDRGSGTLAWTGVLVPPDGSTYALAELDPAPDYDGTRLACVDPDEGTVVAGLAATIDLDPGETVTCTYTNTQRATITVVKDAVPDDDQDFTFVASGGVLDETFVLDDDAALGSSPDPDAAPDAWTSPLLPAGGTHAVVEQPVAGWRLASATCDNGDGPEAIEVEPGANVTCTFVNEATPDRVEADLAVAKTGTAAVTLPAEGGSATVTYTVAVTNRGPDDAVDVVVTDTLPAQVTLESVTPTVGACAATRDGFACDLGNMAAGDVVTIEVVTTTVAAVAAGDAVNVVQASSSSPDPDPSNNRDDHRTTIARLLPRTGADLSWLGLLALLMVLAGAATTRVGRALAAERQRPPGA